MDRKEIKYIELGFENVSLAQIPKEHVRHIYLGNVSEIYYYSDNSNVGGVQKVAKKASIVLRPTANDPSFLKGSDEGRDIGVFGRIEEHADIVDVTFVFVDGTEEQIFVQWDGESEYINAYQTNRIEENGDLAIEIKRPE